MNLSSISDHVLVDEYNKRFTMKQGAKINSSSDMVLHLKRHFKDEPHREQFVVSFINGGNRHICTETLFIGTLTSTALYPREVIKKALEHGAAALILSHNHPSGNLKPSREDINITSKLKEACSTMDILIHDHIIIAGDNYTSFAEKGLL